jgi:hypothetical protein
MIFTLYLSGYFYGMRKSRYNKLILLLLHPAVLALPVALTIILIVPDIFSKYTLTPLSERILEPRTDFEYADLDHDGTSEMFYIGDNTKNGSDVAVYNKSGPLYQWDFSGRFIESFRKSITGDTDSNGFDEIYAFTFLGDSFLLNGIDFRYKGSFIINDRFLMRLPEAKNEKDYGFGIIALAELNGDGRKEIVFYLSSGYETRPRRVFAYDLNNDSLLSSPELGGHIGDFDIEDADNDGKAEIAVSNYGPGNITDPSLPMQDTCAYVLILDNNLQFLFPPVGFPGRYNGIGNQFVKENGKWRILSHWGNDSRNKTIQSLRIYDLNGILLRKHNLPEYTGKDVYIARVLPSNDKNFRLLLSPAVGQPIVLNSKFSQLKDQPPFCSYSDVVFADLDRNGTEEIIYRTNQPDQWVILSHHIGNPVYFKTENTAHPTPKLYPVLGKHQKPGFCFQVNNHQYLMEYAFNPMYYLQYPVYIGIYLLILGFILLVRRIQRLQIQKKYEAEKKMAELQLLSLRNQMDPHFTFNVLNTIGSAILQKRNDESYDLLMKFSKLIRTTINSARVICRPLQEELDFVKNYLDLQHVRHEGLFSYKIHLDADISPRQPVPKMILQTYVENSLRHGVVPRKSDGKIQIMVSQEEKGIRLMVEDNGIGRQQAKINGSVSTGVGLSIIGQYYALLNRDNAQPITETFTDLYDAEGKAAGTRVDVFIPEGFLFPGANEGGK